MSIRSIHSGALEITRKALGILINRWYEAYGPYIDTAPELSEKHIKNCRLIENRLVLIERMKRGGVVCEAGTAFGSFAKEIVQRTSPRTFHIIDRDMSSFDSLYFSDLVKDGSVVLHEDDSSRALMSFPDKYFDWIYIDADHRYEGVLKDIEAAQRKVKERGFLIINDYTTWSPREAEKYGVMKAVNEFCIREGWELIFSPFSNPAIMTWLSVKSQRGNGKISKTYVRRKRKAAPTRYPVPHPRHVKRPTVKGVDLNPTLLLLVNTSSPKCHLEFQPRESCLSYCILGLGVSSAAFCRVLRPY